MAQQATLIWSLYLSPSLQIHNMTASHIWLVDCRPEAVHMDPQQRMLLERAHEALQASHNQTDGVQQTSVLIGIGTVEYTTLSAHLGTGIYVATGEHLENSLQLLHNIIPSSL